MAIKSWRTQAKYGRRAKTSLSSRRDNKINCYGQSSAIYKVRIFNCAAGNNTKALNSPVGKISSPHFNQSSNANQLVHDCSIKQQQDNIDEAISGDNNWKGYSSLVTTMSNDLDIDDFNEKDSMANSPSSRGVGACVWDMLISSIPLLESINPLDMIAPARLRTLNKEPLRHHKASKEEELMNNMQNWEQVVEDKAKMLDMHAF